MKIQVLSYILLLTAGVLSSCINSSTIADDAQKATANISQYMTVNEEFQWKLNISESEAAKQGISQKEYNQTLKDLKQINERIEAAKKETNTTVIFCLPDKQIEINKGQAEVTDKEKTRNTMYCDAHNGGPLIWIEHYLAASKKRINSVGGVSFFTAEDQRCICVQIDAHVDSGYNLGPWTCEVMNDVTKERWIASGNGTWSHFAKEMHVGTPITGQKNYWNIGCSVPYSCACFVDISCYTPTPYKENE